MRACAVCLWISFALLVAPCAAAAQSTGVSPSTEVSPATGGDPPVIVDGSASAARDAEGRGLFEAGRAAFTDGRYEDALEYFDRAYALSRRSALLYNIGSANDRLRRDAEALAAFEEYVRELPDAPNVREVEARILVLRESLREAGADEEIGLSQAERDQNALEAHQRDLAATSVAPADEGPGVVGEWWFWTIIVAVVAGAVVTGVVLGTQDQGVRYPPYTMGDNGVVMTLSLPMP